ncbi:archease [Candidatus Woesearchaeota archaeon]|nr:archease [Candidatus Woesearchaeota archaeon]
MEKKYEFLEHTADAKFRAYGKNLQEAFANAAIAMTNIMFDTEKIKPLLNRAVDIKGDDLKSLLVNFLSEFVYLLDAEGFILGRIASLTINKTSQGYRLAAIAKGDKYSDKYETMGDVKAVTYAEMEIREEDKGKCWVQVVVDI